MVDIHRHDEFSFYDGSGKADELAKLAKEKGHTALGLSNHGNTSGLVQHYDACKRHGIKPILGVEGYFLPRYKEQDRGYHLCLFAKSLEGYKNLNKIQSEAELQKFYNPIIDFEILSKSSEGLICTSACVGGYLAQCILNDKIPQAKKFINRMVGIFGDDFYIEIQPYVVSEEGMQEKANIGSIKLAKQMGVKCILTSDSHRGKKEDIDVYLKMHELKKSDEEHLEHIRETYYERYMPDKNEMQKRFVKMHSKDFGKQKAIELAKWMQSNLEELEAKVNGNIIDDLAAMPSLPVYDKTQDSVKLLTSLVKKGLKARGLTSSEYIQRAKEELRVITLNNFQDYFLIVQDYVKWAKAQGIGIGPGRGSGCNCLVNYALGITDVDPIFFKLDFSRFIREDKKTLPDIDLDFETKRRGEVLNYIVEKYAGYAVQIASYGMYKVDNLVNDLVKTYYEINDDQIVIRIKKIINSFQSIEDKQIDLDALLDDPEVQHMNKVYSGFFDSFAFLYNKIKYLGTHAAGVAISKDSIYYYTAVRYNKKDDKYFSSYNLVDLERCGIVKYDILGLNTLSSLVELRNAIGKGELDYKKAVNDQDVIRAFGEGRCTGVFQYDKKAAQQILSDIRTDSFNDIVAASAMNRPGPLSQGIPSLYAESKYTWDQETVKPVYSDFIEDTFGCILYQEQVNAIAVQFGGLSWNQADKLRKMDDPSSVKSRELLAKHHDEFIEIFKDGLSQYGVDEDEAGELFEKFLNYTFNKGHAVGYALISLEEMYYKVYYPNEFWFSKLKYCDSKEYDRFCAYAVADGSVIFLPHVNYSLAKSRLRKVDGENIIQTGLSEVKNVGEKAADYITQERDRNGIFTNFDDFYDRCKSRVVTSRVVDTLKECGALEFNKRTYINRVTKYNSALFGRS